MVDLFSTTTLEIRMCKNKGPSLETSPQVLMTILSSLLFQTLFRHLAEQEFIKQDIICHEACASCVVILTPAESKWNLTSALICASCTVYMPYLVKMACT